MQESRKTVTLKNGIRLTVDMNRVYSPEALQMLRKHDRGLDPYGLLDFLAYTVGENATDALVDACKSNGQPGTQDALYALLREMLLELGKDGKKS